MSFNKIDIIEKKNEQIIKIFIGRQTLFKTRLTHVL